MKKMQEILTKETNIDKKAYSELYAILQMLGKEYIDKIPEKIYKTIEKRKDDTYNPIFKDMEEVLEGRVKRKTVSILALLDYNYFSTSETDRMYMRYILEENESKYAKEKKEYRIVATNKENVNSISDMKDLNILITRNKMIEYKESGIRKIFKNIILRIREIFRIK